MASIENRSHYQVTVKHRDDLAQTFPHSARKKAEAYFDSLKVQKLKPKLSRLDNHFVVRTRSVSNKNQFLTASSEQEANDLKQRLEFEQRQSLFIDYTRAKKTTLADLLVRYLREEVPRHKSFEVEAYKINGWLEDAGLERQDLAGIVASHPNPHPKVASAKLRKPTGARMGQPSETCKFIRKGFAEIVPDDFTDFIIERCQVVEAPTVDREIDIFSAVCRIAIDTWRIHVAKSPMDGVRRPRYCNERDRRLKGDEESRLLRAAWDEDREQSIARRLEQLMVAERETANGARTVYRRKQVIKNARQFFRLEAEATYQHVALLETFVQFQLMTGARRSETLTLTWDNIDLESQTAFLPETKNGRSRKLALRSDLVAMLRALPRTGDLAFPIGVDGLRKAWQRMCQRAGLTGDSELWIHDLRHEAISRVAEAGSNTPGGFSLVDLQHFSGHRDVRMLLRYAHLCTQSLARRLDAAFASKSESVTHHGRRRLSGAASIKLNEILNEPAVATSDEPAGDRDLGDAHATAHANVVHVNFGRKVS
ncbi:MAG: site-specific integrase [Paraburkholderia tropica]|nr:site-specific integrase [Paraburkholderia tropica]